MKNNLPKIAIKYSEENWKEIKKAVDYLRSQGLSVAKRKEIDLYFLGEDDYYLRLKNNKTGYAYDIFYTEKIEDYEILTMPDDFEKLKSYFEEKKLECGKWYQCRDDFFALVIKELGEDEYNCCVLNRRDDEEGFFFEGDQICDLTGCKPADMQKVKDLLIKEAERRGFKNGVYHSWLGSYQTKTKFIIDDIHFRTNGDLMGAKSGCLFESRTGRWKEIIELKEENAELKKANSVLKAENLELYEIVRNVFSEVKKYSTN